jgi:hypothetical protein
MRTRWNASAVALSAVIWLGSVGMLWLGPLGAMKAYRSVNDRCGGADATRCTIEIPYGYPAADLWVLADF